MNTIWTQHPADETLVVYADDYSRQIATTYFSRADYDENHNLRESTARLICLLPSLLSYAKAKAAMGDVDAKSIVETIEGLELNR